MTEGLRSKNLPPHRLGLSGTRYMYWTVAQLVAHHTCNGCNLASGRPARFGHHLRADRGRVRQSSGSDAGRKEADRAGLRRDRTFLRTATR